MSSSRVLEGSFLPLLGWDLSQDIYPYPDILGRYREKAHHKESSKIIPANSETASKSLEGTGIQRELLRYKKIAYTIN